MSNRSNKSMAFTGAPQSQAGSVWGTGWCGRLRLQAVGADGASNASITFEVWTDGQKRWVSGLMKKQTPAQWVDLDISSAKTLELVVDHGSDNIQSDHANWAEAQLTR